MPDMGTFELDGQTTERAAERLRAEIASKLGVSVERLIERNGVTGSFKRAVGAELLRRQGLTRPAIGAIVGLTKRGVDEALRQVNERMQGRAFREYLGTLEQQIGLDWWVSIVLGDWD
jgi:hypothetical protein